jgi:peptidoglycan/LPS O-acetylase OafA/YrhL
MRKRIPSLDGLRAISIACVLIGHIFHTVAAQLLAALGVQTFFVISGYLITTLLQNEGLRSGHINIKEFYRRRCFRIFPAAFVYISVIALITHPHYSDILAAGSYTVSYRIVQIVPQYLHLWSLSVEEQFYLVWPLILAICYNRRQSVCLLAMGTAAIFRFALALGLLRFDSIYLHYSFFSSMDSIAAGCLLAINWDRLCTASRWLASSSLIIAFPATAWILATCLWSGLLSVCWGIVPIIIALWIFASINHPTRALNNRFLVTGGMLSYSLYLWQQPFLVGPFVTPPLSIRIILALFCAVCSYYFVEQPLMRRGRNMTANRVNRSQLIISAYAVAEVSRRGVTLGTREQR